MNTKHNRRERVPHCRTTLVEHPPRDALPHFRERKRTQEGDLHAALSSLAEPTKGGHGNAKLRKSKWIPTEGPKSPQ